MQVKSYPRADRAYRTDAGSQANTKVTLRNLGAGDVEAIAAIHISAFPDTTLTKLGPRTVRRYYTWLLLRSHLVCALGGDLDSHLVGYSIATYDSRFPAFLRSNAIPLIWSLVLRPWLVTKPGIAAQLTRAVELFLSRTRSAPITKEVILAPVRLVVIAVDPQHQGSGIGSQLLAVTERIGSALSQKEIVLTVQRTNTNGLRFYEEHGWNVLKAVNSKQLNLEKALAPSISSDLDASLAKSLEVARVRAEYGRRSRVITHGYYGLERPGNLYSTLQLQRELVRNLTREHKFPLDGLSIADIGCGAGSKLAQFAAWGADGGSLYGIDLDDERICRAKLTLPGSHIVQGDASALPWPTDHFDLVTQFTMLTSILDGSMKTAVAREMMRVLKPDGIIVWYDMRLDNPMNANIRGISAREVHTLFPNCSVFLKSVTLAPPITRLVVPASWMAALTLDKIPLLRTHYLAIIRKHPTN